MRRSDRHRWAAARDMTDLGELTAQWLEGAIGETPNYLGPPDPETFELVPVLAAANRAGFLTYGSQPGFDGTGFDGVRWMQRAAVEGFASAYTTMRLDSAATRAGLKVIWHNPKRLPRRRTSYDGSLTTTWRDGKPYTSFGYTLSKHDLRWEYGGCSRAAVRAVCSAWQVTIADPEPGRNDRLWPALEQFAAEVTP
jgi:hypothetical protein